MPTEVMTTLIPMQDNLTYGDIVDLVEQQIMFNESTRCSNVTYKCRWVHTWQIRSLLKQLKDVDASYDQIHNWCDGLVMEKKLQSFVQEGKPTRYSVPSWNGAEPFTATCRYLIFKNQ